MAKPRTGYLYREGARWVGRVTFTDQNGKRRNRKRYAETKTEARVALKKLINELDAGGERLIDGDRLTFNQLADHYEKTKLVPAEYVGEKKVAGLRSLPTALSFLVPLKEHFNKRRVRSVTHGDLEVYKRLRMNAPTRTGGRRSIASVNRELEMLRAMFGYAVRQGWLARSPFQMGESVISKADEERRVRVITFDEEDRLLSACAGRFAYLKPLIVVAADTGLRRGELWPLTWQDVDFGTGLILVRAMNAKTGKAREVAMTARVESVLRRMWEEGGFPSAGRVFRQIHVSNLSHHFRAVCEAAGVEGARFHDLRHSCVTRLIEAGIPPAEAMRVSGHSKLDMLARYHNVTTEAVRRAAEALDRQRAQIAAMTAGSPVN